MTPETYKTLRKRLGTQAEVAALLGVARASVNRRENGKKPITREAALAIQALAGAKKAN